MSDSTPLAVLALGAALLAWGLLARQRQMANEEFASGGGEITTDDSTEGTWADVQGIATQMSSYITPANFGNPSSLSAQGLQRLKAREGFAARPYSDHKGYSIGYGHLMRDGESFEFISEEQAEQLLAADVAWAEEAVRSAIVVPITQQQFDALVSFCFNVGAPQFRKSTLVRLINAYDPSAPEQFGRWIYASGRPNPGLIARRQDERDQYESA